MLGSYKLGVRLPRLHIFTWGKGYSRPTWLLRFKSAKSPADLENTAVDADDKRGFMRGLRLTI